MSYGDINSFFQMATLFFLAEFYLGYFFVHFLRIEIERVVFE